jgi:hypothetical protein
MGVMYEKKIKNKKAKHTILFQERTRGTRELTIRRHPFLVCLTLVDCCPELTPFMLIAATCTALRATSM